MASIAEITQGSSYLGNKELGGFIPTAIEIDTKPLQALAGYTVMYNRDQYNQRQKDANEKIAQLAELSKYDIANARGKDKEMAMKVYADLQNKMRDYASRGVPISPEEKVQQEVELKTTVNDAITKIKALNGRGIAYNARLNAINQDANASAAVKSIRKKQLDEEFDSTEWDTPISAEEKYTVTLPKIGAPVYTKNTTSVDTGNEIVQQEVQIFNPAKNLDNATADVFNFSEQTTLPENATPEQRRQFEIQQASGGTVKVLNDAASFLNAALADPKYKNVDGTINTQAVAADNRIAAGILNGIDRYNKYAEDLKQDIRNGFYTTKLGSKVNLLNIINESDVFTIDKNKPLSPEQLVFVQKFLDAAPDQKDEKVIVTGEATRQQGLAVDWYNAKTSRINANKPSSSSSSSSSGSKDGGASNQAALIFGEHINRIKNYQANNGGKSLVVSYAATDHTTRKALGLLKDQFVTYNPDGTAMIGSDKNGNGGTPMTIEQQKLNFIVAVKGGSKEEAQLDAKFIEEQEGGLNDLFGTTSGTVIWNGWGAGVNNSGNSVDNKTEPNTTTNNTKTPQPSVNDLREKYNY